MRMKSLLVAYLMLCSSLFLQGMERDTPSGARTDIFQAIRNQDLEAIRKAANQEAIDINAVNQQGYTPIEFAVATSRLTPDLLNLLLSLGATVQTSGPHSLLTLAGNDQDVLRVLFSSGILNTILGGQGITQVMQEPDSPNRTRLVNMLIDHGSAVPQAIRTRISELIPNRLLRAIVFNDEAGALRQLQQLAPSIHCETEASDILAAAQQAAVRGLGNIFEFIIHNFAHCIEPDQLKTVLMRLLIKASAGGNIEIVKTIMSMLTPSREIPPDIAAEALRLAALHGRTPLINYYLQTFRADFFGMGALFRIISQLITSGQLASAQTILRQAENLRSYSDVVWNRAIGNVLQQAGLHGNRDDLSLFNVILKTMPSDESLVRAAQFISNRLIDQTLTPAVRSTLRDALKLLRPHFLGSGESSQMRSEVMQQLLPQAQDIFATYVPLRPTIMRVFGPTSS